MARPQKEDLLRTLLCLAVSATALQKPASDTEVPLWYCVLLVSKNGGKFPEKSIFRPLYVTAEARSALEEVLTLFRHHNSRDPAPHLVPDDPANYQLDSKGSSIQHRLASL